MRDAIEQIMMINSFGASGINEATTMAMLGAPNLRKVRMEKRSVTRRRVLKRVRVSFLDGACAVECILRNVSDTGALIEVTDGLLIPDQFTLHNELDRYKVDCEVVRRVGKTVGIKFIGEKAVINSSRVQIVNMLGDTNAAQARESSNVSPEPVQECTESTIAPRQRVAFGKKGQLL